MSLTARDRKIMSLLLPIALLGVYWFMVLAPKRAESAKVTTELSTVQGKRDSAQAQVAQLVAAKASFADDYATVIRLGKAVPSSVDMPSLLVQLDRASRGTGTQIKDIKVSQPTDASAQTAATPTAGTAPGGGSNPAAPGSAPAQSFPGKQAQKAGNAVTGANATNQANANAANQAGGPAASSSAQAPPGLSAVKIQFSLDGGFYNLADFFHRMKRFVRLANDQIVVRGRLIAIDSFAFSTADGVGLKADVSATVYLSPTDQGGVSAGASPQGPAAAGGSAPQPAGSTTPGGAPTSTPTPTAAATP